VCCIDVDVDVDVRGDGIDGSMAVGGVLVRRPSLRRAASAWPNQAGCGV